MDTVNVMDFGAIGNGVADDTIAIQGALDSGVCKIYFPTGTYLVTNLIFPAGVDLFGDGIGKSVIISVTPDTVFSIIGTLGTAAVLNTDITSGDTLIVLTGGGGATFSAGSFAVINDGIIKELCEVFSVTGDTLKLAAPSRFSHPSSGGTTSVTFVNSKNNISISDITISGGGFSNTKPSVDVKYANNFTMLRTEIKNSAWRSLRINQSLKIKVNQCKISGSAECAILVSNTGNINISENTLYNNKSLGVYLSPYSTQFLVSNNLIDNCVTYGVGVNDFSANGQVTGNIITNIGRDIASIFDHNGYGIQLQSDVSNVAVVGNVVRYTNTGIYAAMRANYISVSGNVVSHTRFGTAGIRVAGIYMDTNCAHNSITGNTVSDCDKNGIIVSTSCLGNVVSGNTVTNTRYLGAGDAHIAVLAGSDETVIQGNAVNGLGPVANTVGILVENSANCNVHNDSITRCAASIVLRGTTTNTSIGGNSLYGNTVNAPVIVGVTTP